MANKRIIELANEKLVLADGDYTIVDSNDGTYKYKLKRIQDAIPAIDSTLTQTGKAADAKAVGDQVADVKRDLTSLMQGGTLSVVPTVTSDYYVKKDGTLVPNSNYVTTDYINVNGYSSVSIKCSIYNATAFVIYDASKTAILYIDGDNASDYDITPSTEPQTIVVNIPDSGKYIRASQRTIYYSEPSDFAVVLANSVGIIDKVYQLYRYEGEFPVSKKQSCYIDSTGAEVSNSVYDLYAVSVMPNGKVYGRCGNAANGNAYLAFYDKQGDVVGTPFRNIASGVYLYDFYVDVPANATVLKISHRNNVDIDFSVNLGDAIDSVIGIYDKVPDGLEKHTNIDFSTGTSGYINALGQYAEHTTYYHTQPISVNTGDLISVTTKSVVNVVAVIARQNANGSYTPLVVGDSSALKKYTYKATDGMNIVVSYPNDNTASGDVSFSVSVDNVRYIENKIETKIETVTVPTNYAEIFHVLGVIGDSLASGEIAYQSSGQNVFVDKYEYSWLSNICRNCGTTPKHYSKGGMMAKSWLEDAGGMRTAFENDSACNAYFIALGTNDRGQGETLGDITDTSGTETFVGYMKEIIGLIHAKAPYAVIFLVSTYSNSSLDEPWNEMIEAIADLYDYCYFVDFVGNADIYTTSGSPYTSLNHFTTPAYVEVAKTIQNLVNDIVYNNYADFMLFAVNN